MRPPMMVDSLVRRQASTVPARVLASVDSTLPSATSVRTTGIGLVRVNQAAASPRMARMATTITMRRMEFPFNAVRAAVLRLRARQKKFRVDRRIVQDDGPVQVRPGNAPGGADGAEAFTLLDRLAGAHIDARQVHVGGNEALPVVDEHRIAIEEIIPGIGHHASGRRPDRRAGADGDIEPGVRVARLAVEDAAQPETRRQRAAGRQGEIGLRHVRAEAALERIGDFTFARDARQIVRIGIDLALVLDRQALLGISLGADRHLPDGRTPGVLRAGPVDPEKTLISVSPGTVSSGMPNNANQRPLSLTTAKDCSPRRAVGAGWLAGPRSMTATPPGTGVFSGSAKAGVASASARTRLSVFMKTPGPPTTSADAGRVRWCSRARRSGRRRPG